MTPSTVTRNSRFTHTRWLGVTALAAVTVTMAGTQGASGNSRDRSGDNGGTNGTGTQLIEPIDRIDRRLFSVTTTPTALTRQWMNSVLTATGSPQKHSNLSRFEFTCVVTGSFGTMTLEVASRNTGSVFFSQEIESTNRFDPIRLLKFEILDTSGRVTASDGDQPMTIPLPAEVMSALRRAGDIWSPMLTMLGQFEQVQSVSTQVIGLRTYTVLTMSQPKLPGMTEGRIFIDTTTGLPAMVDTTVLRDIPISGRYTITAWQTISGMQIPLTMILDGPDGRSNLTFTHMALYDTNGNPL
ncbi:MAG: hypothetical protein KF724_06300 [Phycisphaeraceae bacterium]|nr:hypothetical protein [Phycisphaeraceae bacterium]